MRIVVGDGRTGIHLSITQTLFIKAVVVRYTPKSTNSNLISDTLISDGFSISVLATFGGDDYSLGAQVSFLFNGEDDDEDASSSLVPILEQLSYVLSSSEEDEEDMRVPVPSLRMKRTVSFRPHDDDRLE